MKDIVGNLAILNNSVKHFGYTDLYKFAADQIRTLTLMKIEEYKNTDRFFKKKYGMEYQKFKKHLDKSSSEEFEKEDDLMDWRFSIESIALYEKELKALAV